MSKEDCTGTRAKITQNPKLNLGINSSLPGRSLSSGYQVDYKQMNERNFHQYSIDNSDSDLYVNMYLGREYDRHSSRASGCKDLENFEDSSLNIGDDAEILSLRQQLEQLSREEALLKKKTEAYDLRRQVAEKKTYVSALKGYEDRQSVSIYSTMSSNRHKRSRTMSDVDGDDDDDSMALTPVVGEAREDKKNISALARVRDGLHKVKVSKHDATELKRQLEGELFDKWEEKYEEMEASDIDIADINAFLNHMEDAYEGIDKEMRKKLNGINWTGKWAHKIYEFKYNKGETSGARYGMVAFGKSADRRFIDCMYVLYKIDFKIAPQIIVTKKKHSRWWGVKKWTTKSSKVVERTLGIKSIKQIQNFFRVKALQRFYNEGLIDSINYVSSIEDIDADDTKKIVHSTYTQV